MRLRKIRTLNGYKQTDVVARLRTVDKRITEPIYSCMERGVILPTPDTLRELCEMYGVTPLELYRMGEIDLVNCMPSVALCEGHRVDRHRNTRKKTFRLSDATYKSLPLDVLDVCGYSSWQSWFDACLRRLCSQYAAISKARKRAEEKQHAPDTRIRA